MGRAEEDVPEVPEVPEVIETEVVETEVVTAEPDKEHEEHEEDSDEVDLAETVLFHGKRIESMDRTLFFGLRGLVMLLDHVETVVNPLTQPVEKAAALRQLQETLAGMKESLK